MYYSTEDLLSAAAAAREEGNLKRAAELNELADLAASSPLDRIWLDRVI